MALLFAAVAATALTVLTSIPAHAEPTPSAPPAATVPDVGQAPTQKEIEKAQQFLQEAREQSSDEEQERALEKKTKELRKLLPNEGGVLSVFNVTDAGGLPINAYTVTSDTGDVTDWDLGLENLATEVCFMATKWVIAFCCWLIAWALSFGLAKMLLAPVLAVANSLHSRVILEMGLPGLFLSVCALICVARIFFGNRAHGFGDAALSLLLAALTTTLLASPPQTLMGDDGALGAARGFSLEVADVILDANPAAPQRPGATATSEAAGASLARPLTDALTDAFIVKPAMLLQYGQTFDGECALAYSNSTIAQLAYNRQVDKYTDKAQDTVGDVNSVLGNPIQGWTEQKLVGLASEWAKNHYGHPPMEKFEEKCVDGNAQAAKKASLDKLGGAVFLLLAALIVAALIVALAASFLTAQARIAWDAIRGEGALLAGIIPGAGRAFLWDWVASVFRSLGQMLVSIIALAVFIVIIQAVLDPANPDWNHELTLRFIVLDILCIAAVKKRSHLAKRSQQIAGNLRAKMASAGIGGTHGSIFSPPGVGPDKQPHVGRTAARGVIRTALVSAAAANGSYLAALGYAMPTSVGATALMSRLNTMSRRGNSPRSVRPAGRPRPAAAPGGPSRPAPPPPAPASTPNTPPSRPATPSGPPPRPTHRPGSQRPAGNRRGPAPQRSQPSTPQAASPRQQQLRQRLERGSRRTPPRRRP